MPRVSVGLPAWNAIETLGAAVQSVLAQTFEDWELIVVDDGSGDCCLKSVQAIRDPRIRVLQDGLHLGLPERLNQIARIAHGDYLARMDADDLMHPQRLQRQVEFLDSHPEIDIVGSAAFVIDRQDHLLGLRHETPPDTRPAAVLRRGLFMHPTVMGRRRWFLENPYRPEYIRAEDLELWCRTVGHAKVGHIGEALMFYRDCVTACAKYQTSCRTERKILRKYGPRLVGRVTSAILIAGSFARETAYVFASALGAESLVIRSRNASLTPEKLNEATASLSRIKALAIDPKHG